MAELESAFAAAGMRQPMSGHMSIRSGIVFLTAAATILAYLATPALGGKPPRDGRCEMIYKSVLTHPVLPDGRKPEGSGLFICHIDQKTGYVPSASVAKSTGHAMLDKAGIDFCKGARFKADTCAPDVKIPITWTAARPR